MDWSDQLYTDSAVLKENINNRCIHAEHNFIKLYSRKETMVKTVTSQCPFLLYLYGTANTKT